MSAPTLRPVARPAVPPSSRGRSGPLRAGLAAGGWALLVSLLAVGLPVLLVWAADPRSAADLGTALRTAGQVWLVAHAAPLDLPRGSLSLAPLGLVLLPLLLLRATAAAAVRRGTAADLRGAGLLLAGTALPHAVAAGLVAALSTTPQARAPLAAAVISAGAVALVGAAAGVLRSAPLRTAVAGVVPPPLRALLVPAAAAVLVLLGAGAALGGVQLLRSAGDAAELARATAPGVVGGVALLLLGLALVPTAVVWGACWWAGPGFAVGVGTAVGPFGVQLGAVPSLPLLAALPSGDLPAAVSVLALAVPLLAGAVAGLLVVRGGSARPVVDAALCGPLAGVAVGALALLAGGAAGGARLVEVGPSAWRCALAVAVEVAAGAAAAAAVQVRRGRTP